MPPRLPRPPRTPGGERQTFLTLVTDAPRGQPLAPDVAAPIAAPRPAPANSAGRLVPTSRKPFPQKQQRRGRDSGDRGDRTDTSERPGLRGRGEKQPRPEPTAIERALKLVAIRERTGRELEQALFRAKVPAAERQAALARMRELGYIDDAATAAARAKRLVSRGESPRKIQLRLRSQGVDAGAAKEAATAAAEGASEDELAARAVQQKLRGRKLKDLREKERVLRALVQKGHRPSAVAKALSLEWDGDDGVEADE